MFAVWKKELKSYFFTLTGWIFIAVFLLVSGIFFSLQLVFSQSPEYSSFLAGLIFIFLLVVPLITMRVYTDEKRFQTDQLLLTGPTSLWAIVLGKYFAALTVFFVTLLITVIYPLLLTSHGKLEWPMIIGTYIGFFLLGSAFIAIGVYVSQAAEGIVGAAVLTFCALIVTFIIDFLRSYIPTEEVAGLVWVCLLTLIPLFRLYTVGKNWPVTAALALVFAAVYILLWFFGKSVYQELIGKSLEWISLTRRFSSFSIGILNLDAVIYYLSFSAFFIFLTIQGLEKRRWN